jgi:hypothetical protein
VGYTNYYSQQREVTNKEWLGIMMDAKEILAETMNSGIPLAFEYDLPHQMPEVSEDVIQFNGIGGNGHETFYLPRSKIGGHGDFCKTARKPYDVAVGAIMLSMDHHAPGAWSLGSDGDITEDEWIRAMAMYCKATGRPLDAPPIEWLN